MTSLRRLRLRLRSDRSAATTLYMRWKHVCITRLERRYSETVETLTEDSSSARRRSRSWDHGDVAETRERDSDGSVVLVGEAQV